jgi:hypothetical protein
MSPVACPSITPPGVPSASIFTLMLLPSARSLPAVKRASPPPAVLLFPAGNSDHGIGTSVCYAPGEHPVKKRKTARRPPRSAARPTIAGADFDPARAPAMRKTRACLALRFRCRPSGIR